MKLHALSFSSTGLPTATRTHLESLIASLGGSSTRTMSSATTHLIVPNDFASLPDGTASVPPTSAPKLLGALKWKCKVVTAQWVVDLARGLLASDATGGYELPWWPAVGHDAGRMQVRRVLESLDSTPAAPVPPPPPVVPAPTAAPPAQQQQQQQQPPPIPVKSPASSKRSSSQHKHPRSKFRIVSSDSDSCTTTDDGSDHNDDPPPPPPQTHPPPLAHSPPGRLFSGYALAAAGFPPARLTRLRSLVRQHAGTFVDSIPAAREARAHHASIRTWVLVLPMVVDAALAKVKAKYAAAVKRGDVVVGSENWLQHCLLDNTIHPLTHSPLFNPLHLSRLPALSTHIISLSGFSEIDQASLEAVLAALGATLSASLTRACTLLLYASPCTPSAPSSSKFDKAMQWNIPVVPLAWLTHVLAQRAYARPDKYRLKPAKLIFEGLVVYVTGKVKASAAGAWVAGVVEVHGGKVVFAWASAVTHVVHVTGSGGACVGGDGDAEGEGAVVRRASLGNGAGGAAGAGDGDKEVKLAKHLGKHVVSPWWVSDSVQAKHRLPELAYPPNYDPARQLHIVNAPAASAQPLETYRAPPKPARALEAPATATARTKKVRRAYDPDVVIVSAAEGSPLGYAAEESAGGAGARKRAKVVAERPPPTVGSGGQWSAPQGQETPSRPPRVGGRGLDLHSAHRHEHQEHTYERDVDMDAEYHDAHMDFESTARPPPPLSGRPRVSQVVQEPAPHYSSPPQHQPRPPTPPPPTKQPTPPPPPPSVDPIAQDLARKQAQMTADLELMLADLSSNPPPAPAPAPVAHASAPSAPPSPTPAAAATAAIPASTAADRLINLSAIYTQPGGACGPGSAGGGGGGGTHTSPRKPLVTYDDPEGARARKKLIAATARGLGAGDRALARAESGGSTASASASSSSGSVRQWAALAAMMKNGQQGPPPKLARSESEASVVRKMVEGTRLGSGDGDGSMSEGTGPQDEDQDEVDELASDTTRPGVVHMQQPRPASANLAAMDVASVSDTSTLPLPAGAGATSQLPNALLAPVRPAAPPTPLPNAPRVALSGCTADRDMYESMITALGGHLMSNPSSTSSWVNGTTHLVISVPISCEKCMCAIASGAWLLRPSFLEASYQAGHWVAEHEHAWAAVPRDAGVRRREVTEAGERAAVERMDVAKSLDLIAGWERVFRTIHGAAGASGGGGTGAFRGWRVVLAGAANTSSYRNLLVAGGAVVISDGWDPDKDPDAVTHVLVQSNRLDPHLAANDIVRSKTYSATLIIQSLMGDQPPTPVLLRRMSSRSFGSGSSAATSSASGSGSVSGGGASRGQAGYVRPQRQAARVQSVDAASTGSTAY